MEEVKQLKKLHSSLAFGSYMFFNILMFVIWYSIMMVPQDNYNSIQLSLSDATGSQRVVTLEGTELID